MPWKSMDLHERFDRTLISVPHAWLVIALMILPVRYLTMKVRVRKHFGPGQCAQCGYDIRVTPKRCPECGMVPAGK